MEEMISQEATLSSYVPGCPLVQESSLCSLRSGVRQACWHFYSTCFSTATWTLSTPDLFSIPVQRNPPLLTANISVEFPLILGKLDSFTLDNSSTALSFRLISWYNSLFHSVMCYLGGGYFVCFFLFFVYETLPSQGQGLGTSDMST